MMLSFDRPGKLILGLNYSGAHDTAVAVVTPDGEVLSACSLERLSRLKQDGRFPDPLLEGLPWNRIESVAIPTDEYVWSPIEPHSVLHPQPLLSPRLDFLSHPPAFYEYMETLSPPKKFVCHQLSHAACTFW